MGMTTYDVHENVIIFDEYHQVVVLLLMIACLMIPLGGYTCVSDTETFQKVHVRNKDLWKHLSKISVFYILLILWGAIYRLGYHIYSVDQIGIVPSSELTVSCNGEDTRCCSVYAGCSEGHDDSLEYDTYVFTWSSDTICPTLSDMVPDDYDDCEDSEYGCCMIQTTCDSYARLHYGYSTYMQTAERGSPYGYVKSGFKSEVNGTNCPTEKDIIYEYVHDNYTGQVNYVWIYGILMCIFTIPCYMYRHHLLEILRDQWKKIVSGCEERKERNERSRSDMGDIEEDTEEEQIFESTETTNKRKEREYDLLP